MEPPGPNFHDRLSRLEAIVERLAEQWETERTDIHAAIEKLRDSGKTKWSTIASWASVAIVVAALAGGVVAREVAHVRSSHEDFKSVVINRFLRNEKLFTADHDDVIRNAERWRLYEEGLLKYEDAYP